MGISRGKNLFSPFWPFFQSLGAFFGLKNAKNENDTAVYQYKKELWRSIMSQKMGLKQIKALNNRGNELNLMGFGENEDFLKKHVVLRKHPDDEQKSAQKI